ncbi:hypothetical protein O3P69_014797 [Scylla paramamosain]|uniref:Schlafen AlbA-2 domain-containing protein n=1 Tax=Scylla paramamosain TaxID=85552 RepID=A0AAW0U1F8_SCYPA
MAASEDNPHLTLRPDLPPDLPPDLGPDLELGRHYVKGQQVNVTEDLRHEFKGHRSISVFDLPSRWSVGGMMNTGVGGTVYLGVSDAGRVVGLPLTGSVWTPQDACSSTAQTATTPRSWRHSGPTSTRCIDSPWIGGCL